jgi:hypothetical protein
VIRLDALTRRREAAKKDDAAKRDGAAGKDGADRQSPHIEISLTGHEEPTWDVRHPGDLRRRRRTGRTRAILSAAAAAAVVVNAGAAWVYWQVTGSETGRADTGTSVALALRARSDLNHPLLPGQTGSLSVTVTNNYDFPIRITSITPGVGEIVADDVRRDDGCKDAGVRLTGSRFAVSWDVPRNTIGAFTIANGLVMRHDASPICGGAVFTVPIQAFGVSRESS